jgi:hypothetical protein
MTDYSISSLRPLIWVVSLIVGCRLHVGSDTRGLDGGSVCLGHFPESLLSQLVPSIKSICKLFRDAVLRATHEADLATGRQWVSLVAKGSLLEQSGSGLSKILSGHRTFAGLTLLDAAEYLNLLHVNAFIFRLTSFL